MPMKQQFLPLIVSMVLCILLPGCSHQKNFFRRKLYFTNHQVISASKYTNQQVPTISVWIHGARPFGNNTYNLGLKSLTLFDPHNKLAETANILVKADSIKFPLDNFYIFSWPGTMDFGVRQQEAITLHTELLKLLNTYKMSHGIKPRVRIIAHSHGGNVALNLAAVTNNMIEIDELILLATPVQDKNKDYVRSPLFKRVFSLYSTIDIAQIIDPQGIYHDSCTHSLFSGQRFNPSQNLMQIKTKINGTACQHLQFDDRPMLTILPAIIDQLHEWMDKLPQQALLSENTRFMLSVYTNGRRPPQAKCYRTGGPHEHIELPIPSSYL